MRIARVYLAVAVLIAIGANPLHVGRNTDSNTLAAHGGHKHGGGTGSGSVPLAPLGPTPCVGGFAGPYPCARVDLASFVPLSAIGGGSGNDIWGWTDLATQKEYALVGRSTGTSFVDVSNPGAPVYLGTLPSHTVASVWRGIKVYADHAFVVSEAAGHGLQVFDLAQLRSVTSPPLTFAATAHYAGFSTAHTVAINEETGTLYAAGTNTCGRGLHMVDIRNPVAPVFAGCFSADGYTHETQCVVYRGVDARYLGREICFNSNEDTLTIVDVTTKSAPVMLSRATYPGRGYTHQGWLTPDHRHFLLDDEKDETNLKVNSRTHVWDVSVLTAPRVIGIYEGASTAIDHNLYVRDGHAFMANYRSGLRVADTAGVATATLREIGFFDVHPDDDLPAYSGAWSTYPFFPSRVVLVNSIERGLFVLRPKLTPLTGPDLIVSALSSPARSGAGMPLDVTYAIDNQGGSSAPATRTRLYLSVDAKLDAGDALLTAADVPPLASQARDQRTTTVTVPPVAPGSYYLLAAADGDGGAVEEIENNNVRPRFLWIGPDFDFTAVTAPATASPGASIAVTYTVENKGGATTDSVALRLWGSLNQKIDSTDRELAVRTVPPIAPGGKHSATTTVTIPVGTSGVYYLIGHVDADNIVAETNESNNTRARGVTIQP